MISLSLSVLFVLVLVVAVPALAYMTAKRSELRWVPRRELYFSAVLSQWILTALVVVVVVATPWTFSAIGLRAAPFGPMLRWTVGLTVSSLVGLTILLRLEQRGWWPPESELVHLLLPKSREEKLWAVAVVAPTAALCEELAYRGFLLAQLSQWFDSVALGLTASAVAFALAHFYQGRNGMVRVALLGVLLACPVVELGSLYPSMVAHFLIDALALAWLGPKFIGPRNSSAETLEEPPQTSQ